MRCGSEAGTSIQNLQYVLKFDARKPDRMLAEIYFDTYVYTPPNGLSGMELVKHFEQ